MPRTRQTQKFSRLGRKWVALGGSRSQSLKIEALNVTINSATLPNDTALFEISRLYSSKAAVVGMGAFLGLWKIVSERVVSRGMLHCALFGNKGEKEITSSFA